VISIVLAIATACGRRLVYDGFFKKPIAPMPLKSITSPFAIARPQTNDGADRWRIVRKNSNRFR
jgi:hypothetical protein